MIDEEVKKIFDEACARCQEILLAHEDELRLVAEYLLVHESMEGADFAYVCEHKQLPPVKNDGTVEAPAKHISMVEGLIDRDVTETDPFQEFLKDRKDDSEPDSPVSE